MKYFSIVLLLALVVVLAVSFWPKKEDGGENPSLDGQVTTSTSSPTGTDPSQDGQESATEVRALESGVRLMGTLNPEYGENYTFADSDFSAYKEGTLLYTVTGGTVITNINELPEGVSLNTSVDVNDETGSHFYKHPYSPEEDDEKYLGDFVLEDGSFISDVYMVLLTVRFESQGATCYLYHEKDGVGGLSYDPYLFYMDFIDLTDIGEDRIQGKNYGWDYYSGYKTLPLPDDFGEIAENEVMLSITYNVYYCGLRLEPGEAQEVTLGYMISPTQGHLPNPEDLCAVTQLNSMKDGNYETYKYQDEIIYPKQGLYLGLSWPEGME